MNTYRNILKSIILVGLIFTASSASAVVEWKFSAGNNTLSSGDSVPDNYEFNGGISGVTAKVSGWANSGVYADWANTQESRFLKQETVKTWNGLGIERAGEGTPQHAVDNHGPEEMALFSFSQAVTLKEVSIGYYSGDADITVLAYMGSGAPDLTANTYSPSDSALGNSVGLLNDGWSLIGNYYDLQNSNKKTDINDGSQSGGEIFSSSYYLVGALNWIVNGTSNSPDFYNDFFKISALKGDVTPQGDSGSVPEPSSLLLLLLAMIGWTITNNNLNRKTFSKLEII